MKIDDIANSLEEMFANNDTRDDHFNRHVTKSGKAKPEILKKYPDALAFKMSDIPRKALYDELADKAARKPVSDPDIRGYIDTENKRQKYNVKTLEITSYRVDSAGNPVNITYFRMKPNGWERCKKYTHPYKERLTPEKDANPE